MARKPKAKAKATKNGMVLSPSPSAFGRAPQAVAGGSLNPPAVPRNGLLTGINQGAGRKQGIDLPTIGRKAKVR